MLLSLALAALPQNPFVRPPVQVDAGNPFAVERAAADFEDQLAAVLWISDSPGPERVWCSVSTDGARSFAAPVRIDADTSGADKAIRGSSIRILDGALYACWLDERDGAEDLYFRVSRDGGATWEAEQRLDDGAGPGIAEVRHLKMELDPQAGIVVGFWTATHAVPREVRVVRSTDLGVSFLPSTQLFAGTNVGRIDLDVDGSDVHVVWQDDETFPGILEPRYQRSRDGGATWLPSAVDIAPGLQTDARDLRIAADHQRVAVVYQEQSALCSIAINMSTDGGTTWMPTPRRVAGSFSPACVLQSPRLLFTPAELVVAWADDRNVAGLRKPWLAWTADLGATWTEHQLFPTHGFEVRVKGNPVTGNFAAQWNGAAQIYAATSRTTSPAPGTTFVVDTGNDLERVTLRRDARYEDYLSVWLEDDAQGNAHVWAAGFRTAHVIPTGQFQAGGTAGYDVAGFPLHETGWQFHVFVSNAMGNVVLPFGDGRTLGLAPHPWLNASAADPRLRGTIRTDGTGSTSSVPFPASIPPGSVVHHAAASFQTGPTRFGTITDVRRVFVF